MDPSNGRDQEMRADDQSLESILTGGGSKVQQQQQQDMMTKPTKPAQPEHALKCPRCDSTNTKFCYYNNYSLSQPRYFCKSCRRYWTKGGTLRNVPVGGGCRKNKRTSSSSSSKRNILITHQENPNFYDHHHSNSSDQLLALEFAHLQHKLSNGHFGNYDHLMDHHHQNHQYQLNLQHPGFLESQGLNHMHNLYYGFPEVGEVTSGVSINNNNNQDHMSMFRCEDDRVKQEACSGRENESRFLLGNFPWQNIGNGGGDGGVNNLGELSMRGSWNNGINMGSSNWQGLINSPLM